MNAWILAATILLGAGLTAALWGVASGPLSRRMVAQNLTTAVACPSLLLLAQGYHRPSYVDLALLLALLGPVGTLVFARLLADELAVATPAAWGLTWTAAGVSAAVVVAVCAATGPSRAMVKLLVTGVLLIGGNLVASRALQGGFRQVRGG
ncbi:monovalent cation/H+ antiporter complex subunit F [Streptomyces bicolor]|uniref:monovalent cation/H+ antiporter complex subunit F n=1 Tax=Streptomyces bicolor TaxID=66874 RepID=UPI0004E118D0|nr:monovalent cation/H+ antiporter complex subunit F [Streptomyces bicolor]